MHAKRTETGDAVLGAPRPFIPPVFTTTLSLLFFAMKDKILVCIQCGNPFVFSSAEQARFQTLDFVSPRRCPECRKKKAKRIEDTEKWDKDERKRRVLRRKRHTFYDDE
jgi:hypothetical protein